MLLEEIVAQIASLEEASMAMARDRQDVLTKPRDSLGCLENLSIQLVGIFGQPLPEIQHKVIVMMAGDHGVVAAGVSAYPQAVTAQMVNNFLYRGTAINVLARHVGARVVVVDIGVASDLRYHPDLVDKKVAPGTADITYGPAMSRDQALQAIMAGVEVVETELERGLDILGVGEMGIGNTTPSSAIASIVTGRPPKDTVGWGTGVDDAGLTRKIDAVERALLINRPDLADALDVLAKIGGFEIGGLMGTTLAAVAHRKPVMVDGFISTAAAVIAVILASKVRYCLIAAYRSKERGHRIMLDWLGLEPLLDLEMCLGEGTGAAIGISLAEAACKILREMATFGEADVSEKLN